MRKHTIYRWIARIVLALFLLGLYATAVSCAGTRHREKSREQEKTKTELREQIERETSEQKEKLENTTKITNEQIKEIVSNIDFESIDQDKDFELNIGVDDNGNLNIKGRNVRGSKSEIETTGNKSDTTTTTKKEVWHAEAKEAIDLKLDQETKTDNLQVSVESEKEDWLGSLSWSLFWIVALVVLIGIAYYNRTSLIAKAKSIIQKIIGK